MIELINVYAYWYKGQKIAGHSLNEPISLVIPDRCWVAVVGENGIGKSTLLHALAGTANYVDGGILVDDISLKSLDVISRFNLGIQHVPQHESFSGATNIDDAFDLVFLNRPALRNIPASKDLVSYLQSKDLLDTQNITPRQFDLLCSILSIPKVLLLDEVMSAFPSEARTKDAYLHLKICLPTSTVIFVDHDINRAIAVSDYILWLRVGEGHNKTILFPTTNNGLLNSLKQKLGYRLYNEVDLEIDQFDAWNALKLDITPLMQLQLALQARNKNLPPVNIDEIISDFDFLKIDRPAEELSGGRRVILLWLILEISKISKLPEQYLMHLDGLNLEKVKNWSIRL